MSKVIVVGVGNVGVICVNVLVYKDLVNEVVFLDIKGDMVWGKVLDSWQQVLIDYYSIWLIGMEDYVVMVDLDIVVIIVGIFCKFGMSCDDLIVINVKIVNMVFSFIMEYLKNFIIIVVFNLLDVMIYVVYKVLGFDVFCVFGMAGIFDIVCYWVFLFIELNVFFKDIQVVLMGGYGDIMVLLFWYIMVVGIFVLEFIDKDKLDVIVECIKVGGGELVKLMGIFVWYVLGVVVV